MKIRTISKHLGHLSICVILGTLGLGLFLFPVLGSLFVGIFASHHLQKSGWSDDETFFPFVAIAIGHTIGSIAVLSWLHSHGYIG